MDPVNGPSFKRITAYQGSRNGRFGKRGFCPQPQTGGFDRNRQKTDIVFDLPKTRGSAPQTLEIDENHENGGCHSNIAEITVCFDNLEPKDELLDTFH